MNFTKLEAISHYLDNGISEERDCTCPRVFRSKTLEDTAVVCAIVSAEEMYIDELVPNAFKLLEAPGILYTLEDAGFVPDGRLSHLELISKSETPVISETHYSNILVELKKYDITFVIHRFHCPPWPFKINRFISFTASFGFFITYGFTLPVLNIKKKFLLSL